MFAPVVMDSRATESSSEIVQFTRRIERAEGRRIGEGRRREREREDVALAGAEKHWSSNNYEKEVSQRYETERSLIVSSCLFAIDKK